MAASPGEGDTKHPREGGPSPESSLTWCLAHLSKAGAEPRGQGDSTAHGGGREPDKRWRACQWRALVAIRTQHIKGDKAGIATFRKGGGLRPLLELLQHPQCSRKTLDLALSILANCCTEAETRVEVRKHDGIEIVVDILKRNVSLETVQNRAARALGNLAIDPESSALIHSTGGVPPLLQCVSLSSAPSSPTATPPSESSAKLECAQSAARALLYLSDTPTNRLSLLAQGAVSALAPLLAPDWPPALRRCALRALHELTRGCSMECAKEVSRSGVLAQLGVMASGEAGEPLEELALKSLANLCSQGCLRPLVGSLGVIQKFTEEVKREPLKSGLYLKALCLCCKEAVNRAKVKESGGLEALVGFLSAHHSHPLARLPVLACVDFVFDESAMEQLLELGVVPPLVARLVELTKGGEESADKTTDVGSASDGFPSETLSASCFDSFDFPAPDGSKKDDVGKEQCSSSFLSLRSWLLSEGLISSEGDLLDSPHVEGEWGSLHLPFASSPNSTSSSKSPASPAPKKAAQPPCVSKPPDPLLSLESRPPASTPPSSSKLSFPLRRRQRVNSVNSLTNVTLEAPPPATRLAAYQHPYHPEPWTPESPILLLLSRFSHCSDPSGALVGSGGVAALLHYLTLHQDPSSRCFRTLCRLSCDPNCLQALVRTGAVALIHHLLCQNQGGHQGGHQGAERQTSRVKAKVKQLGAVLLNNLRVQCESNFGSGVLAHVMLTGSETDRIHCALSLPLLISNKCLLKKLLVDSGGLLLALQPLSEDGGEDAGCSGCQRPPLADVLPTTLPPPRLYFSLLIGCLSALTFKPQLKLQRVKANAAVAASAPPLKRARLDGLCAYGGATFDLTFLLDDGTRVLANRESVSRVEDSYFGALLRGGFDEARIEENGVIGVKDVSRGMIVPVMHHLHGCRLEDALQKCRVLDSLVHDGLPVTEHGTFQETALGQAMVGACRFLVSELQAELQDLCSSLLGSRCRPPTAEEKQQPESAEEKHQPESAEEKHQPESAEEKHQPESAEEKQQPESADENLASRTLALELSGTDRKRSRKFTSSTDDADTSQRSGVRPEDGAGRLARGLGCSSSGVSALLPQLYWFCQRYSYSALRLNCLELLLGAHQSPPPCFRSRAAAGDCLRRLAREPDGSETLKQDLLSLASAALT